LPQILALKAEESAARVETQPEAEAEMLGILSSTDTFLRNQPLLSQAEFEAFTTGLVIDPLGTIRVQPQFPIRIHIEFIDIQDRNIDQLRLDLDQIEISLAEIQIKRDRIISDEEKLALTIVFNRRSLDELLENIRLGRFKKVDTDSLVEFRRNSNARREDARRDILERDRETLDLEQTRISALQEDLTNRLAELLDILDHQEIVAEGDLSEEDASEEIVTELDVRPIARPDGGGREVFNKTRSSPSQVIFARQPALQFQKRIW